jgi:hypothetical protein
MQVGVGKDPALSHKACSRTDWQAIELTTFSRVHGSGAQRSGLPRERRKRLARSLQSGLVSTEVGRILPEPAILKVSF